MSKEEKKRVIDWEAIEKDWRAGIKSVLQIAKEHEISHTAINKRFKKFGVIRDIDLKGRKVVLGGTDVDVLNVPGFVYVIYLDDSAYERFYKIGMAFAFTPRFQSHQCSSPFDICVAAAYYVGNMRAEERALHARFSDKRVRGEWFRLDRADLMEIANRALLV